MLSVPGAICGCVSVLDDTGGDARRHVRRGADGAGSPGLRAAGGSQLRQPRRLPCVEPSGSPRYNDSTRSMSDPIVEVHNLRKAYCQKVAVADVSFAVVPGESSA